MSPKSTNQVQMTNLKWKWKHQNEANRHKRADNHFQEGQWSRKCFLRTVHFLHPPLSGGRGTRLTNPNYNSETMPIWKGSLERNATVGDAKFNQGSLLDSGLQAVLDEPSNKYYITLGNSNSIHAEPYHFWIIFLRPEQIVFSFCLFLLFSPTYCVLK